MGTRAIIKIENIDVALYKHCDGAPDSTLPWLVEFHSDFLKNRGEDPCYEFAQLIRSSSNLKNVEKYRLGNSPYIGWGVITFNKLDPDYMGAQYVYTLKLNGEIEVKEI